MRFHSILAAVCLFVGLVGCNSGVESHLVGGDLPAPTLPLLVTLPGQTASPVLTMSPTTLATATPGAMKATGVVAATPEAGFRPMADSYCLWPGDTLSAVAGWAKVDLAELETMNPGAIQYAGAAIHLPRQGISPDAWIPQPTRPADAVLLPFGVSGYYLGADNRHKRVALTFDIGYAPENVNRMIWLHDQGISATFFVLGLSVSRHPQIVTDVLAHGHHLGNHSWDHLNFQELNALEIEQEFEQTENAVQSVEPAASTKPYFRAPFGAINADVQTIAAQQGYHIIGWTVDSHDWMENITGDEVYQNVIDHICPGAIIAMHDVNPANSDALPRIVAFLRSNGYEFVSLQDLMGF